MKLLYKPFGMVFSAIAAKLGNSIFKALWGRIDKDEPPKPTSANASGGKAVAAATLEAATMAAVGAMAERAGARTFEYFTGVWPGETPEDEKKKEKKKKKKD